MNIARRQSSTTSMARFARESQAVDLHSPDFCNAFWGKDPEKGVEALLTRMRVAGRTLEEIRAFWRERAAIEDDYAKRLIKLSKLPLGREETGELRSSISILKAETEKQAGSHATLAQSMKRELDGAVNEILAKHLHHKRTSQAAIDKAFKTLVAQESFVGKAHDKYKTDCININLYTAQSTLQQGKDLEKTQIRLEKAKQTVNQNERDYANSVEVLRETSRKWELDWKSFCDQCQDLEDERLEFMKDNLWGYANFVSTVCVSDDESCEKLRVALEQLEPEKDVENFVLNHSTGGEILELPKFHSYASGKTSPPTRKMRQSNFTRSSSRPMNFKASLPESQSPLPIEEASLDYGQAGIGARGNVMDGQSINDQPAVLQEQSNPTGAPSRPPASGVLASTAANGRSSPAVPPLNTVRGSNAVPHQGDLTTTRTQIAIGPNVFDVNPEADPQPSNRGPTNVLVNPHSTGSSVGDATDPIAQALADLKNGNAGNRSYVRRPTTGAQNVSSIATMTGVPSDQPNPVRGLGDAPRRSISRSPSRKPVPIPAEVPVNQGHALPRSASPGHLELQAAADSIVGQHPSSRPSSPVAPQLSSSPRPVFMQPPRGQVDAANVVKRYDQSLPGERRVSRQNLAPQSTGSSNNGGTGGGSSRPSSPSQQPFAGVGAHGRVPGPGPPLRAASPVAVGPSPVPHSLSVGVPPSIQSQLPPNAGRSVNSLNNPERMLPPSADPRQQHRAASPTTFGISLDPRGRVTHDALAEEFAPHNRFPPGSQPAPGGYMGWPQQPSSQNIGPGSVPGEPRLPSDTFNNGPRGGVPERQNSFRNVAPQQQPAGVGPTQANIPRQNPYVPQQLPSTQPPPAAAPTDNTQQLRANLPPQHSYPNQGVPSQPQSGYSNQVYPQQQRQQSPANYPQQAPDPQYNQPQTAGYYSGNQPPQAGPGRNNVQAAMQTGPQYAQQYQQPAQNYGYPNQFPGNQPPGGQPMVPPNPSPQPPSNPQNQPPITEYLEDGTAVLFYVKALYDYVATIEEEFDFQTGDIIAVTATPEDGWWSGVLLDDVRRVPGRTVFPSNFVCLF